MSAQAVHPITGIREDDIVIGFMGPTGSGKSNFIRLLTNRNNYPRIEGVADAELDQSQVQATRVVGHPTYGDRLVLVEVPGFDNITPDTQILKIISEWLGKTYENNVRLSGLVFLYPIIENALDFQPFKNLQLFGAICGDIAMKRVVLVSTRWEKVVPDVGIAKEQELRRTSWEPCIRHGSKVGRLVNNESAEAWGIIEQLSKEGEEKKTLLLQEELVNLGRSLKETQVGKILFHEYLSPFLVQCRDAWMSLRQQVEKADGEGRAEDLRKELDRADAECSKAAEQTSQLKIPILRRITMHLAPRKTRAKAVVIHGH